MTKRVVLERDGKRIVVALRQEPHDEHAVAGARMRYGKGKRWVVVEVGDAA